MVSIDQQHLFSFGADDLETVLDDEVFSVEDSALDVVVYDLKNTLFEVLQPLRVLTQEIESSPEVLNRVFSAIQQPAALLEEGNDLLVDQSRDLLVVDDS